MIHKSKWKSSSAIECEQADWRTHKDGTFDPDIPIGFVEKHDNIFSVLLCLDPWEERDEARVFTDEKLWHKVNPNIGTIVQPSFYREEAIESELDPNKYMEFLTKNMNIFQSERMDEWLRSRDIIPLQVQSRVDDLDSSDEWCAFVGFDFSMGDDLYAMTWLCVNRKTGVFFADMDAWVSDQMTEKSPLRPLYDQWSQKGWLHIIDGKVFDTALFLGRIQEVVQHLDIMAFGYDPFKSRNPINDLAAFIVSLKGDPKQCIIPVRQNYATTNPLVLEIDTLINHNPPLISFSDNPMWPWEFGNCRIVLSPDKMGNRKIVKSGANNKVDNVQCLMNALHCFDLFDGRPQEE